MAKKHKISRKAHLKHSSLYSKIMVFLGFLAIILGMYCYFIPKSSLIPLIPSRHYPKRTRGAPVEKTTYAVYDRLAGQSAQDKTRLLPPDEVPDWKPSELNDPSHTVEGRPNPNAHVQGTQKHTTETKSTVPQGARSPKIPLGGLENPLPEKKPPLPQPKLLKPSKPLPKPSGKPPSKALALKNTPPKPIEGTVRVRLQIGTIQSDIKSAERIIQTIGKKGRLPPDVHPTIQKATIKGKTFYRVMLVGRCSPNLLKAYQTYLRM